MIGLCRRCVSALNGHGTPCPTCPKMALAMALTPLAAPLTLLILLALRAAGLI